MTSCSSPPSRSIGVQASRPRRACVGSQTADSTGLRKPVTMTGEPCDGCPPSATRRGAATQSCFRHQIVANAVVRSACQE
eukprot:2600360-Alexandrium_andersonii.AAC.1